MLISLNLQSWLHKEFHAEINHLLVGFGQVSVPLSDRDGYLTYGQTICLPVGPRCNSCDLSNGLCPSANKGTKSKMKREKLIATVRHPSVSSSTGGPKIEIAIEQTEVKLES